LWPSLRKRTALQAAIPAAIAGALKDVTGFAGCLVMISDQEAYLDRRIRVQTMVAHLPVIRPEMNAASECFGIQNLPSEDETACVA
jgi:hypothetical protein